MTTETSVDPNKQTSERTISSVPAYDEIVERNQIDMLLNPGDLVLRNGDLAMTKWGDLMLIDEDYSAFFRLVQEWRFNYPTLKVMFDAVFDTFERQKQLMQDAENSFPVATREHPHPLFNPAMDVARYHRALDEHGAVEVARGAYAGSVVIVIVKVLQSFKDNIVATEDEWKKSAPLFGGCSVGQILEASANNVRHNDEWAKAYRPNERQLKSIMVLSAALREPLASDGRGHKFGREICPETLQLISGADFNRLENVVFTFAKNLMDQRQKRLPKQWP